MADKKQKRIFAGYYERYDHTIIHVAMVIDDVDTGDKIVIFNYEGTRADGKNYSMRLDSFCADVEYKGKVVPKFKRRTNIKKNELYERALESEGFIIPRKHRKQRDPDSAWRSYRRCKTYEEYAKDLCVHYNYDLNLYNKTVKAKRLLGLMGKDEFNALKEDLIFLNDCFETSLNKYKPIFRLRYIKELSVRKTAEELGKNRGSIEYAQNKMISEFAALLQKRDQEDKTSRLNQNYKSRI